MHAVEPSDSILLLSAPHGGACPHETPLFRPSGTMWPQIQSSVIRFSFTTTHQVIKARWPLVMNLQTRNGATAFIRFTLPDGPTAQSTTLELYRANNSNRYFDISVMTDGTLRADMQTDAGRVMSTSSVSIGHGSDEIYAIQYDYATSKLWVYKYTGAAAVDVTVVTFQV